MEWILNFFPGHSIMEKAQVAASVGTWFAGTATFFAALIALHLGVRGTKPKGKFLARYCSFYKKPDGGMISLIRDSSPPDFTKSGIIFDITNTNHPLLRIRSITICSAFSKGSFWLPGTETTPTYHGKIVQFGDTLSFILPMQFIIENKSFLDEYKNKSVKEFFYFRLEVSGGKVFKAALPSEVHEELRTAIKNA